MLLSLQAAASRAGVSRSTIYTAVQSGQLPGVQVPKARGGGCAWLTPFEDLERWVAARRRRREEGVRRRPSSRPHGPPRWRASGPYPPSVLLRSLVESRRRGEDFETAWPSAVQRALAAVCEDDPWRRERRAWSLAFDDTRSGWQEAYEGTAPPAQVRAAAAVGAELDAAPDVAPPAERARGVILA